MFSKSYPASPLLLVDAGDWTGDPTPQGGLQTDGLIEGMNALGYKVSNLSLRELAQGYDLFQARRKKAKFELVSAKPVGLSSHYPRTRHAPAGLAGGQPGAIGRCFHNGQPMLPTGTHTLQPGDRVVFELPGGGGYGPPSDRDPALAAADLRAGYVTL